MKRRDDDRDELEREAERPEEEGKEEITRGRLSSSLQ